MCLPAQGHRIGPLECTLTDAPQAFATEINSPLKPPTQNKEGHQPNVNGRKASVSHGAGNAYGVSSPSSAPRPGTRRRETHDANPFSAGLNSPSTTGRFGRDDQGSQWLPRKTGEGRDADADEQAADAAARDGQDRPILPNLMRANTSGSAGMSSMWPSSNPSTPGIGGFGNFAIGSGSAVGDKRVGASSGGSRLAHLMPKESSEGVTKNSEGPGAGGQQSWRTRPRTDTDPFGEDELAGSAMLGGSHVQGSSNASRVAPLGTPVKGSAGDFGMSGLALGEQTAEDDPTSPSETNPYRSPAADRSNRDDVDSANDNKVAGSQQQHDPSSAFGLPRGFGAGAFDGSDRSQTSSVGAKGYNLGSLSGWPAPGPTTGTPDRERPNFGNAFGSSLFGNMGDLQSPGLSNLGNVFGPSASGGLAAGSIGRGSKLGSLFPPAMQAQMQSNDQDSTGESSSDMRQNNPLGAIGRGNFPIPNRDSDSPMRANRGVFEDLFPSNDGRSHGQFPTDGAHGAPGNMPQTFTPVSGGMPFGTPLESSAAQVRQMVMPDRMRWVYLDPQGQVQGPFTGLEMNDWYKANFFTPDLRVKKVEDPEFEPLGQLIRRIGNSREPFLVPQIGVAHGQPSQGGPFNNTAGVVPPLSGVFPSFGRTLTADEQNNLERRKQEEQYLMAQQRDYMMRQQPMPKFPMPGQGLQHHSSAQSLQSQPSFGSMSNPLAAGQQSGMAPPGGFPEQGGPSLGSRVGNGEAMKPEDMANLNATERQLLANMGGDEGGASSRLEESLKSGLPTSEHLSDDPEGFRDRLQEFEGLRAQQEAEQATAIASHNVNDHGSDATGKLGQDSKTMSADDSSLSLTQQVQITQAAAAAVNEPGEPGMPMPFPPPSSTTPLPAPTAQRVRSNLPEQYSRSQSGTPDIASPPPLAPWAKEPGHEGQRGPSLKEIQEAEARKAAKDEEAAAAIRRAAMEQEGALLREREKASAAAAAAAALPASSTWGHGSPASASAPWSNPSASKPVAAAAVGPASSSSKKTLADIQREEEVRKRKAREVASQSGVPASGSKSYANLAGKPNAGPIPGGVPAAAAAPPGAGWATVGAGGKVKAPTGVPVPGRPVSASNTKASPAAVAAKPSPKPSLATGGSTMQRADTVNVAIDEFNKWVHRELSRGLDANSDGKFR